MRASSWLQLLAIVASGSRAEDLARLDLPALVVHGRADTLIDFSGGQRTAELIAGRMAAPGRATIARYMIEEWLGREL